MSLLLDARMSDAQIQYYKQDSRKIRYAEYWRICKTFVHFLVAAQAKLFSRPIDYKMAIPRVKNITYVESAQLHQRIQDAIRSLVSECASLGPELQFVYALPMVTLKITTHGVAMLNADGTIVPQVFIVQSRIGDVPLVKSFSCVTKFSDGRIMVTSNQPKKFDAPDWSLGESMAGSSVKDVYRRHAERLKNMHVPSPVAIAKADLEAFIVEQNNRFIDYMIARGIFVPMTDQEVEYLRRKVEVMQGAVPTKRKIVRWLKRLRGLS